MAVKVQLFEHIDIEHFYLDVSNSDKDFVMALMKWATSCGISMSKTDLTVSVIV